MATQEPYSVELWIVPFANAALGVYELELYDHQRKGRAAVGVAALAFEEPELRDTARAFLRGEAVRHARGLAYGRALAARLFAPDGLGPELDTIHQRRGGRPLRVELVLPTKNLRGGVALDEIPFELLADAGDGGFWFRRPGWSLVRTFEDLPAVRYRLPKGSRALLAWANPALPDDAGNARTLPAEVFAAHEDAFAREAGALRCDVRPHLQRATADGLAAALRERPETPLLSLVAHGDPRGGALLLHADDGGDEGRGVLAHDLAKHCRDGGVKVTLLWSCHGARRHVDRSSVAAALLDPEHGDGAAVVASHAALVADRTARLVGPLLRSLRDVAAGDLERALAEARHALDGDDLQWAAPVYYARPLEGRSVTVESSVELDLTESALRGPRLVEGAPDPKPWFRGRVDDLTRVLAYVKAHRLTTLTGGPGIGKTTLAAEAARRAIGDAGVGLSRAVWLDLSSRRSVDTLREALALVLGLDPARCATDLALAKAIGDQRALAVLDNAEDLLRVDGDGLRGLLDTVLRHAPGLRALVTSRRALGDLEGVHERRVAVDRLPPGVDREVFVAAAGAKLGADAEGPAVAELVRALAGHPQSIVLVAGQVGRGLTLAELLARVKAEDADVVRDAELLDDEVEESSDARLRSRRLVSSLNLSFLPLVAKAPGAAEMFAWLGNFPGGLPEALVTGVFGEEAKRHLGRLLGHNMVERRGVDDRITLAGPVRWYARAQQRATVAGRVVIAAARRAELMERSAGAMAGWLEALERCTGRPGAASACARAREDGDALEVLAKGLRDAGDGESVAARLGEAFYAFAYLAQYGAYHREAEDTGEAMRDALRAAGARRGVAEVGRALGDLYVRTARLVDAERAYGEALPIYRAIEERIGEANTLQALGDLYLRTDRLVDAERAYGEALPIYRAIDARLGEAYTLQALGSLSLARGAPVTAFSQYTDVLRLQTAIDDRLGLGGTHGWLTRAANSAGRFERAVVLGCRAFSLLLRIDNRFGQMLAASDLVPALAPGRPRRRCGRRAHLGARAEHRSPLRAALRPAPPPDEPRPRHPLARRPHPARPHRARRTHRAPRAHPPRAQRGPLQPPGRHPMTDRLVVVSDVHLAVPGPLNNFHAGDAFADFVAAQCVPGTTLVLAGDVFDFLQIPGRPERLRGDEMPALIATTLDALAATPWGARLFAAFGALLQTPGARVVVTPGNHDPEVAHPAFASQFLAKAGLPADHPGLAVHADGMFRVRVGLRDVVVAHGHRTDPWNDIAPATVSAALAGDDAPLPTGSRLVTRVLNAFKDARDDAGDLRFPFVDLLKPELPSVPLLLLYLDRRLAMEHLPAALGLGVETLPAKLRLSAETLASALAKALVGGSLGLESVGAAPAPADDVANALAATYSPAQRANPGRAADELAVWLEEGDVGGLEGTLAPHGGMRARMLRAFLRAASDEGRFFDRTHRSEDCVALTRAHLPADATPFAVIGGHTHAAREVWLSAEHVYLNTGTWTDLMAFPSRIDDAALRDWIDALERRDVPRVRHLTWAEVTPTSVGLHEAKHPA